MREVAADFERPVLLFSGGKDSIVLLRLAEKAFRPARFPCPILHIDTGHNFPEVLEFRDRRVAELGEQLIVASRAGLDRLRPRARGRPVAQPAADGHAARRAARGRFDAAFGGARRDEERARAKERVLSFRDELGQWEPRNQRPEVWDLFNTVVRRGESVRAFPISNWTELDVWRYIEAEKLEVPSIYYAHEREVFERDGMLFAVSEFTAARRRRGSFTERVRYRTVGDLTVTGAVRSDAVDVAAILAETAASRDHRARRHPRRRPHVVGRHGRPQARGLFLVARTSAAHRHRGLGRRRQVDPDRPAAARLQAAARRPARAEDATSPHVTDGLRAEREQGITIDVAYRFFATPRRSFILADTPGHVRYTRNMVTGASTADLALVLIDARKGLLEQSRRHAYLAALLGIRAPRRVREQDGPRRLRRGRASARSRRDFARAGRAARHRRRRASSRSRRSRATTSSTRRTALPWYDAPPLLGQLETVEVAARPQPRRRALPRPVDGARSGDYRGYAGRVAGGVLRPGDEVVVLPVGLAHAVARDRHARRAGRARRSRRWSRRSRSRTSSTSAAAT